MTAQRVLTTSRAAARRSLEMMQGQRPSLAMPRRYNIPLTPMLSDDG
jgi:hypothetical protein